MYHMPADQPAFSVPENSECANHETAFPGYPETLQCGNRETKKHDGSMPPCDCAY
jgi:hypothetical protein